MISTLGAVCLAVLDRLDFEESTAFYERLLGVEALRNAESGIATCASFPLGNILLQIVFEHFRPGAIKVAQSHVSLFFESELPDDALETARERGAFLPNDVFIAPSGARGFCANDPAGISLHVGTQRTLIGDRTQPSNSNRGYE